METKTFELWVEGYAATGESSGAQCLSTIEGTDFNDAVKNYVEKLRAGEKIYWNFRDGRWGCWGCRAFDNETDARKAFG